MIKNFTTLSKVIR